jgi:hypothetical protein
MLLPMRAQIEEINDHLRTIEQALAIPVFSLS